MLNNETCLNYTQGFRAFCTVPKMAAVYENSDFIFKKRSHLMDKSSAPEVISAKWPKVLLVVVGVCLVFALGLICALSVMYAGKFSLCDSLIDQHNVSKPQADPGQKFCISVTQMDLLGKYLRAKDCLASCTEFIAPSCNPCGAGWTAHDGKCYFFSSDEQTWFEGRNSCVASKSHLVTINSKAVQDFLESKIKEHHWIGLNDLDTEGQWVWVNNQTLNDTGVQFWFKKESGGEPDNSGGDHSAGEDCACLGYENVCLDSWFDASCEKKKKFICEKEYSFIFSDE